MANFSVIIDGSYAFNLEVLELADGFYDALKLDPIVVDCSGLGVSVGDNYVDGIFYSNGVEVSPADQNLNETKFAFIVDGSVSIVQNIPNIDEMLVAAYSSDPRFIEVVENA
jgi:hypothetical protein